MDLMGLELNFNPLYGNSSQSTSNATHFGEMSFWYFQRIPHYIINAIVRTEKGKIVMNYTIKPCDAKMLKRMDRLLESIMKSEKLSANEKFKTPLTCPMEKVSMNKFAIKQS